MTGSYTYSLAPGEDQWKPEPDASGWQPSATAPIGQQVIFYEPMYGWLVGYKDKQFGWMIKSSGNFYSALPREVVPTHWHPLPDSPSVNSFKGEAA